MKDFIELIKENAINYPSRIAVIDRERKINYNDFLNVVNCISINLINFHPQPKVLVDLQQGFESYTLIIAILNIGGIYCPLNTHAHHERKVQIINEFKPDIIVVENKNEFNLENVFTIDELLDESIPKNKIMKPDEESIIYIIYTSGTTGISKGVKICRKALNKFLEWSIPTYAANEKDVWGQYSLLSFDLSIVDIFTCLCSGATLLAMNDPIEKTYKPSDIIQREKITIWHSIPSSVEFMIKNNSYLPYDFSSLRIMSFCGEPLQIHQVKFLFLKNSNVRIFNTYGPTEGTLFCTWQEVTANTYMNYCHSTISIGKPIPGWNIKLNDIEESKDKEIIIYGDYIGKGYLVDTPNSKFKEIEVECESKNSFETGDLILIENGNYYFSCRKDNQVKIGGIRIELDEIDFRINEFINKVSMTVVIKNSLCSFIECEDSIDETELRNYLKEVLENYKIPKAFYRIKEMPRNQNCKIDKNALIKSIL